LIEDRENDVLDGKERIRDNRSEQMMDRRSMEESYDK